jgi:hypothetical protein
LVHGQQSQQEIIWIASNEKIKKKSSQVTGSVDVFDPRSGISDPLRGELSHVQIFMNDGHNTLT